MREDRVVRINGKEIHHIVYTYYMNNDYVGNVVRTIKENKFSKIYIEVVNDECSEPHSKIGECAKSIEQFMHIMETFQRPTLISFTCNINNKELHFCTFRLDETDGMVVRCGEEASSYFKEIADEEYKEDERRYFEYACLNDRDVAKDIIFDNNLTHWYIIVDNIENGIPARYAFTLEEYHELIKDTSMEWMVTIRGRKDGRDADVIMSVCEEDILLMSDQSLKEYFDKTMEFIKEMSNENEDN